MQPPQTTRARDEVLCGVPSSRVAAEMTSTSYQPEFGGTKGLIPLLFLRPSTPVARTVQRHSIMGVLRRAKPKTEADSKHSRRESYRNKWYKGPLLEIDRGLRHMTVCFSPYVPTAPTEDLCRNVPL